MTTPRKNVTTKQIMDSKTRTTNACTVEEMEKKMNITNTPPTIKEYIRFIECRNAPLQHKHHSGVGAYGAKPGGKWCGIGLKRVDTAKEACEWLRETEAWPFQDIHAMICHEEREFNKNGRLTGCGYSYRYVDLYYKNEETNRLTASEKDCITEVRQKNNHHFHMPFSYAIFPHA